MIMTTVEHVKQELREMALVGLFVPSNAIAYVDRNEAEVENYREEGMKISEIADLVCGLSGLAA
jgi:hypothetical protein